MRLLRPTFKNIQEQGFENISGQAVPPLISHYKIISFCLVEISLAATCNSYLFSFHGVPPRLSSQYTSVGSWNQPLDPSQRSFLQTRQTHFPQPLLLCQVLQTLTTLVALHHTPSSLLATFLRKGAQNWAQYSRHGLRRAEHGIKFPLDLLWQAMLVIY